MKTKMRVTIIPVIAFASIMICKEANHQKSQQNSISLKNIEALASREYHQDFAEKQSITSQDGPYYQIIDNEVKEYYWVYTEVICLGEGVVKCEPDLSAELIYTKK